MTVATGQLVERIWERDPTVWTGSGEEKWLGWLDEPQRMRERIDDLLQFVEDIVSPGVIETFVLMGMGGSSLAPIVFSRSFAGGDLHVLDTTHPAAIRRLADSLDLDATVFIASSKSGSTLETRSHLDYFWERNGGRGEFFVAITDPGSELESLAHERGFARVFAGEPTIGGRYSALSPFGIVPAVLLGIDLEGFFDRTAEMVEACRFADGNPGLELGRQFGEGWQEGQDKICIDEVEGGFGLWAEQLIAESTGKNGRGLVPAPGESPAGQDRQRGEVRLEDPYELGQEVFRWEFAVAVAGSYLEINPFDQPDVQAAKDKTNEVLAGGDVELEQESSPEELFAQANEGDYVSIQAFIDPSKESQLGSLIERARQETECVVTHGLGPRYLHSTGQLHKGGPNTGLFLQVVDDAGEELPIPGKPFGFARLIRAQAAGDFESLKERGRRVARIRLEDA